MDSHSSTRMTLPESLQRGNVIAPYTKKSLSAKGIYLNLRIFNIEH